MDEDDPLEEEKKDKNNPLEQKQSDEDEPEEVTLLHYSKLPDFSRDVIRRSMRALRCQHSYLGPVSTTSAFPYFFGSNRKHAFFFFSKNFFFLKFEGSKKKSSVNVL